MWLVHTKANDESSGADYGGWGDVQVLAAGDMCAICQEKMHAPISLCCKHIFCEDCVSEWYAILSRFLQAFFNL
jgi:hypothetical protein